MPLNIVRQDITKMHTDAIVAAEGHDLSSHGMDLIDAGEEFHAAMKHFEGYT